MSNTPAPHRSCPGPRENTFAPHRVSSLCRAWLSQTEPHNMYASAASYQSSVVVTTNEPDSVLEFLSTPSTKHQDLEGLQAQLQSDSYRLAELLLELPPTGSFARSKHELQMQHSPDPPYTPIVVHLPNGIPKELKTAAPVPHQYVNARSASVTSSSLSSTAADSTKTVLKFTRSSSAVSDQSQTLMFALGFSQLNFADPAASRWVNQVIGDERSSVTPPIFPGLARNKSLQPQSACWPQPDPTFIDPYLTTCRLRGGGGPSHQRILNSIQNTPQSAYRPRPGTQHSCRSSDTSRPPSSSGSSNSSGSGEEVRKSANFTYAAQQKVTNHEITDHMKTEEGHHNIKRQRGRASKPKATTRKLYGLSEEDACTDMEGSTIYYAGSPIPRHQSEIVQPSPSECISGHAYLRKHRFEQTMPLETDHRANTHAYSNTIPSLLRIHRKHVRPVFQPGPLPSAKPNLHTIIESYLSVLESIIGALDVHLQDFRPSPSLRGGCCIYACCCSDEKGELPSNNRAPPSNVSVPQPDNREQPPENPTPTPPRGRTMDRQERLFKKSYAETDAIELHEFTQGRFRKSVGGDSLSYKGPEKKASNATDATVRDNSTPRPTDPDRTFSSGDDLSLNGTGKKGSSVTNTAVSDNSGSNATDTAAGDKSTSSPTEPSGSASGPSSSTIGSIFGPFSPTSRDGSTLASTRTPLAWEDSEPSWSFSQAVPRLRGGGANKEDEGFEESEEDDAAYQIRTMVSEVMSRTNSCPGRLQSSSQGILSNPHFWFARSRGQSEGDGLFKVFQAPLQPGDRITPMANIGAVRTETYSKHRPGRRYADARDIRQARKDIAQAFENRPTPDLTLTDPRVRAKLRAISVVWEWLRGGSGGDDGEEEEPKDDSRAAADKEEEDPDVALVEVTDKEEEVWEELPPRSNSNMFHPAYYDRTIPMGPNPKPNVEKPRNATNEFASSQDTRPPPTQIRLPGVNWVFTYNPETRIYEPTYVGPHPNAPQTQLRNDEPSRLTQDRERLNPDTGSAETTTSENLEKVRQDFEEMGIDDERSGSPPPPYSE